MRFWKLLFLGSVAGMSLALTSTGFSQTTELRAPAAKGRAPQPSPATEHAPSAVEMLNKSLNPGASDPDVPLPHPDLANRSASPAARSTGAQIYGRQEEGGGVLGFKVPIPVDRGGASSNTTSGTGSTVSGSGFSSR